MNERLVGGVVMKDVAWRVFTLAIVFLGLIGFADFTGSWLFHILYFVGLSGVPSVIFVPFTILQWAFVIVGIIFFYRKTK